MPSTNSNIRMNAIDISAPSDWQELFRSDSQLEPQILFDDDDLVAIDKPAGWYVHPAPWERGVFTLQDWLQAQLASFVYPAHRLDRATQGIVLFAKNSKAASHLAAQFRQHTIGKTYWALTRGWPPAELEIHSPLKTERGTQSARTFLESHIPFLHPTPFGRYPETRLALVRLTPFTGRQHQLRRHMAHIRHPIVGDSTHGDSKLNRHLRDHLGWKQLQLFATQLSIRHPRNEEVLILRSDFSHRLNRWIPELTAPTGSLQCLQPKRRGADEHVAKATHPCPDQPTQ